MNCQEFWKRLSKPPGTELDLGGEHRAHLAECVACSAHLARQQELAHGLRRLAESTSGLRAPGRVEARLLRAFRVQNGATAGMERNRWLVPLCWATAAALLVAAGLLLTGTRQPATPHGMPAVAEMAAADPDGTTADAEGFIPLPNAERIAPNEDVNLVRMEVPRSTMMALGFSVSDDRVAEPVEADVLLGPDGLARAVRFLD